MEWVLGRAQSPDLWPLALYAISSLPSGHPLSNLVTGERSHCKIIFSIVSRLFTPLSQISQLSQNPLIHMEGWSWHKQHQNHLGTYQGT